MRIWMLASLLVAVTAIGGDRGMERSSQVFDRVIATSPRLDPFNEFRQSERATARCCKVCTKGKPCSADSADGAAVSLQSSLRVHS